MPDEGVMSSLMKMVIFTRLPRNMKTPQRVRALSPNPSVSLCHFKPLVTLSSFSNFEMKAKAPAIAVKMIFFMRKVKS